MDAITRNILEEYRGLWKRLESAISCGKCDNATKIDSGSYCGKCGRVLCPDCGNRWGWCKDHSPQCYHPELMPVGWKQKKPEPEKMIGSCKHNMSCPVCGFGWGAAPDTCNTIRA